MQLYFCWVSNNILVENNKINLLEFFNVGGSYTLGGYPLFSSNALIG